MNGVDLTLLVLLTLCALRGYWRGFFREVFGLLALIGGLAAAVRYTGLGAVLLQQYVKLPSPVDLAVTFVVIFVMVRLLVNLIGVLLDHLAGALLLQAINRVAGACVGVGKGATVLAFVLLFLHLFPVVSALDERIMDSTIGRPLMTAAGNVARLGLQTAAQPSSPSKT